MADEWAVRRPHPALRPYVTRYVGYRQSEVSLTVHRGLPSRHVTLIISLQQPVRMTRLPDPARPPASLQALVGGMHVAPVLIEQDRVQEGLHLELNPLGIRTLLGIAAAEVSGHVLGLAELGLPALTALPERLAATPEWQRRFAILDEVLLDGLARRGGPAPEVDWAWRRLLAAGGRVRATSLAGEVGWSRRHFGERFRRELGLSPKQAARVLRFEQACALLRSRRDIDLAELAVSCGYYDQPHLTNEWRALAGCSPGTWIAEELPNLPDPQGRPRE